MKENIVIIPRHDYDAMVERCRILDYELKDILSGKKSFFYKTIASALHGSKYVKVEDFYIAEELETLKDHISKLEREADNKDRESSLQMDKYLKIVRKINCSSFWERLKYLFTGRLGK